MFGNIIYSDPCADVVCKYGGRCEMGKCACVRDCPSIENAVCASDGVTYPVGPRSSFTLCSIFIYKADQIFKKKLSCLSLCFSIYFLLCVVTFQVLIKFLFCTVLRICVRCVSRLVRIMWICKCSIRAIAKNLPDLATKSVNLSLYTACQ